MARGRVYPQRPEGCVTPLKPELRVDISHPPWVLGTKHGVPGRDKNALSAEPRSLQPPDLNLWSSDIRQLGRPSEEPEATVSMPGLALSADSLWCFPWLPRVFPRCDFCLASENVFYFQMFSACLFSCAIPATLGLFKLFFKHLKHICMFTFLFCFCSVNRIILNTNRK